MGIDWYDMIAIRNGGYKGRSTYAVEGISAEHIFESRLIEMLPNFQSVLDTGCGHGEFTLRMSNYAKQIIGFDNSIEMIKIAQTLLHSSQTKNVKFVYATTKTDMPFADGQFDLIYDRRGPTSIINHARLLSTDGVIFGIHNNVDAAKERLVKNGFRNIEVEEYNTSIMHFSSKLEFSKFLSDIPGNPDYTLPELRDEFEKKVSEHTMNGRIEVKELKYIWKAVKP